MNRDQASTAHLLRLLAEPNSEGLGYGELIARSSRRLMSLTRSMLKDYSRLRRWEQTDDVFQLAVLRLYQSLSDVQPTSVRDFLALAATQIPRTLIDLSRHLSLRRAQRMSDSAEILDELVWEWMDARAAGRDVRAEDVCARHSDEFLMCLAPRSRLSQFARARHRSGSSNLAYHPAIPFLLLTWRPECVRFSGTQRVWICEVAGMLI